MSKIEARKNRRESVAARASDDTKRRCGKPPEGSGEWAAASNVPSAKASVRRRAKLLGAYPDFILLVLLLLASAPLVARYFGRLWAEEHYQYFPLLIGVIVWLGWSRWHEAPPAQRPLRRGIAFILAIPAALFLSLAILYQVPIMAAFALVLWMAIAALALASHRKVENLLGIWCLSWLLIRLPWGYDEKLMELLQALTTTVSSRFLDFFGALHLAEGNVLTFPGKTFFVDEACSGIISLRTILAATAVIVVWHNRPLLHGSLLIAAGLFWAGIMNVIRIGIIAVAYLKFGFDLSTGWQHDFTGVLVFVVAVGGVLSTDAMLTFLLAGIGEKTVRHPDNPLTRAWNRVMGICDFSLKKGDFERTTRPLVERRIFPAFFRWSAGTLLAVLFLLQGSVFLPSRSHAEAVSTAVNMPAGIDPADVLGIDSLSTLGDSWHIVDFEKNVRSTRSMWGENSLVWTLEEVGGQGLRVQLSLDYYFRKWHELTVCYRASGWQLDERMILPSVTGERAWRTVRAQCHRPASHERGLMYFDLFRSSGEPLQPVEHLLAADWKERFSVRNMAVFKGAFPEGALEVLQVQAFVVTDAVLEADRLTAVRAQYEHFRDQVFRILMSGGTAAG